MRGRCSTTRDEKRSAAAEMRDQIVANLSRQSFSRIVEELRVGSSLDIRPLEEVMAEARQSAAAAQ